MRSIVAIAIGCVFLLQLYGCTKQSEETEISQKKEETVVKQESGTTGTSLTPQQRVEMALSVKDKEISLTGKEKATIETNKGTIVIKFYSEDAPNTVKNFIRLATVGFYDGLTFHRYVPDFVIQGGDPRGDGAGNAGYNIDAEFNQMKHVAGTVAMARSNDPNSASCQFYITLSTKSHLDGKYTVFGHVVEGMPVANQLRAGDTMDKITIE